jgi:hypothetical protein
MNGFAPSQMPREGLFARISGRPLKEHAYLAIQNLLASTAIKDLRDDSIFEILEHYRPDADEAREKLKEIYATVLRHFARDLELDETEFTDLRRLKILFDLNDSDVLEIERHVLDPYYESTLSEMLGDRRLSPEERTRLENLAKGLRLPDSVSARIQATKFTDLVQGAFNSAVADRRLSPEEDAEIKAIAENLHRNIKFDKEATAESLDYFRLLWRLEQGELPEIAATISLRRGEVCHAMRSATHLEFRRTTQAVRYAGPYARIRIMKGIYYRLGQVNVQPISKDVLQPLDNGTLYLTSQRLIFDGSKKNTSLPFSKIINFVLFADGLQIEKETGRDVFFEFKGIDTNQMELWGVMLRGAMRKSRSE